MTGTELRAWRRAHSLTQAELAALLETHTQTVSNWERGRYPIARWVARVLTVIERSQARRAQKRGA